MPEATQDDDVVSFKRRADDKEIAAIAVSKAAAAEHRLYNLSRLVSAWIWETDADFRLTNVSYRIFDILGIHPQELIGRRLGEIGSFVTLEDFPEGGESQSTFRDVFFEAAARDGQKHLFLVSGLPVYDQDGGAFQGMQGIAEDVTRHPRADAEFEKLFAALEDSLIMVMIANSEGEIEYANTKFQEATGYNLDELKQISPEALVEIPKDKNEERWESLRDGNEWRGETHYRRKNGALFSVIETISPIPSSDGGVDRLLWVVEDDTAQRVYRKHVSSRTDPELFTDMPSRIKNAVFLVLSSDNCLITKLQMENLALGDAMNRLPLGVIVVDAFSRPIRMNRSAKEIIETNDGLSMGRDGLQGTVDGKTVRMRDIIWRTGRAAAAKRKTDSSGAIALERPSGFRPLSVVVTPLRTESHYFDKDRPAALIFISDPEAHPEIDENRLCSLYGLTRAEARLATLLAQDLSLADAADELEVSQHTVRTHVKRIFSKTTTERQSGLIRLLLSGPAQISRD
jgi:PAS domain S-box-containing protein